MLCTQINDNGIISFVRHYNVRTPVSLPLSGTDKIIAPYWADVDTRGTGNIYYRQTTDPSLLARTTSEIRAAFPDAQNVTIKHLLITTWDRVGYYFNNTDKVTSGKITIRNSTLYLLLNFAYRRSGHTYQSCHIVSLSYGLHFNKF